MSLAATDCPRERMGLRPERPRLPGPMGALRRLLPLSGRDETPIGAVVRHVADPLLTCEPIYAPGSMPGDELDAMLIRAEGDLSDSARVRAIYRLCNRLFDANARRIILDLTQAERLDTKAVGALIVLHKRALIDGHEFRVRCSEQIRQLLAFCRISSIIDTTG